MPTVVIKHGAKADIPSSGMTAGQALFCTDTGELFVATDATTKITAVPDLSTLGALGSVAVGDLVMMQDVSAGAGSVAAKKITFADFKTALNIPAGAEDEKVGVDNSATAGYLWSSDGTTEDGVLRAGNGLAFTDGGDYVTLALSLTSEAQGDIMYRGASSWDRLAKGTAGQFLKMNSGATAPEWTDVIDGGTFT